MAQIRQFVDKWELRPPRFLENTEFWKDKLRKSEIHSQFDAFHECWAQRIAGQFLADYFGSIEKYRANCWTMAGPDDPALWALYAHRQTGVVIQSNIDSLFDCIAVPSPHWEKGICIAPIKYVDYDAPSENAKPQVGFTHRKYLSDHHLSQIAFMYKTKKLAFEKEIRVLSFNGDERLKLASFEFIKEVTVGPDASQVYVRFIERLCEENGISAPVRQSSLRSPEPRIVAPIDYSGRIASIHENPADRVIEFRNREQFLLWYKSISEWSGIPRFSQRDFGIPTYTDATTLFHYGFVCNYNTGVFGALTASVFAEDWTTVPFVSADWALVAPPDFNRHLAAGLQPMQPPPARPIFP